jgi:hypothetical protein
MQRHQHVLAIVEIAAHPLDLVGIDVRRRHLHRRRQVDDQLVVRRRLHHLDHRVADLQRHFQLGAGKALRRILEAVTAARLLRHVGDHLRRVDGDLLDPGDVLLEHHPALQLRRRIVEMHDRPLAPSSASKVRVISSGRHCTSTCSDTSSGTSPSSTHQRAKSKSVCEADGKPISISLNPMSSSSWNIRALRSCPIGLISDWLPSRRVDRAPDRRLGRSLGRPGPVGQVDRRIGWYFSAAFGMPFGPDAVCAVMIVSRFLAQSREPRAWRHQPASGRHVAFRKKCKVERGAGVPRGGFDRRTLLNEPGDRR